MVVEALDRWLLEPQAFKLNRAFKKKTTQKEAFRSQFIHL